MDQTLQVKYNSLRRPEFRLVTEIRENEKGKYVVKRAGTPAAVPFANRVMANRERIQDYYREIRVLQVAQENGTLIFPFVEGLSLEESLARDAGNMEAFLSRTEAMLEKVFDVQDRFRTSFRRTEAFEEIFGETDLEGVPALCPANIDALFGNFIENDDGVFCLDYEWIFDFAVPADFLKYRVLRYFHYHLRGSLFDGFSQDDFLKMFGFSEGNLDRYGKMEMRFQEYVHGEKIRYHYLHHYLKAARDPQKTISELKSDIVNAEQSLHDKEAHIVHLEQDLHDKEAHIVHLEQDLHDKETHIVHLEQQMTEFTNSFFWRITRPARSLVTTARNILQKNDRVYLFFRCAKAAVRKGPKEALALRAKGRIEIEKTRLPEGWPTKEEASAQKETAFGAKHRFSILVPLYNTPKEYLKAMIQSVQDQTYEDWELCLADGSDAGHSYVRRICKRLSGKDPRIRYRRLEKNLGISANTNACIEMATGDYIALLDHDDMLHPSALFEAMRVICDKGADFIYTDENTFHETPADAFLPHYKPDFSPDTLRSYNYICHLTIFKASLLRETSGFRSEMDGSQDYDLILRLTERAQQIVHIPKVLYYWRGHEQSVASDVAAKPYTLEAAKRALTSHLDRVGLKGKVYDSIVPSTYKIQYEIEGEPLISIVIPSMDHKEELEKCVRSILDKCTWKNLEIIIVENNSRERKTFLYYQELEKDERIRVITWKAGFNFSGICNFGAENATGEYILLLNNDIEILTPDWLEQMLMFAQRKDVGAVGAMMYYPDDTIQHAGVILGIGGVGGHSHKYFRRGEYGYASRLTIAQNLSAVTAACIMIPRHVWQEVKGLDEGFAVAFNDVDLCMRIRRAGYLIVWTPYAEMYHYESKSRGQEDTRAKQERFSGEVNRFIARWGRELEEGDPYYNPNLTLKREDFSFRDP